MDFDKERFLKEVEYLVNIDSGTGTPEGISQIADFLKQKYENAGFDVKLRTFDPAYGTCVEARNYPEDEEIDLLLIGHMDTVFPKGTAAQRPFRIEGDCAFGPGVADMKSGLLLGAELAEHLIKSRPELRICIANNCDEEIGSSSTKAWLTKLASKSKYCLDFEPGRSDGSFVKTRKGVQRLLIKIQGVTAHAGVNPKDGVSAILEMSNWVCHFAEDGVLEQGTTVNFGVVNGGTVYNMIPGYAEADVDIRFDKEEQLDKVMQEFYRLEKNPFSDKVQVTIEKLGKTVPMITNESSINLMGLMEQEGAKLGQKVAFVGTGGGSDASNASSAGAATMDACGPVGFKAHNEGEYILIYTIEERFQLMVNVCKYI